MVDAFLIVDQPRQRLGHWTSALAAVDDPRAPALAHVAAYYDPTTDQALIALRYDELALRRDHARASLSFLVDFALLAEIGMIQPRELSEGDRRRFLAERLARCTLYVGDQRTVVASLTELVRRLRDKAPPQRAPSHSLTPRPLATGSAQPPNVAARGTRDRVIKPEEAAPPLPRTITNTRGPFGDATPAGMIYAKYLRSGRWVAARIGALSLKGAALMSLALPRVGDHVDIALSFGELRAFVRGQVTRVASGDEVIATGAATFTVSFLLDDNARAQLTALLTAARNQSITIGPPPARAHRRYLVEWPVGLGTTRGVIRGEALDVSASGMFVRPKHALTLASHITFSITLDDGCLPVSGRAKVVRQVDEDGVRSSGLTQGFGLAIIEMPAADRGRWDDFVARIAKRAEKRVLVGAPPDRMRDYQAALAALGYAVTGGSDLGAVAQLVTVSDPFDAVLLDGAWLTANAKGEWIGELLRARNVVCVTAAGDARRSRIAVDRALTVE